MTSFHAGRRRHSAARRGDSAAALPCPATRQRLHIAAAEGHQQVSGDVRHSAAAHTVGGTCRRAAGTCRAGGLLNWDPCQPHEHSGPGSGPTSVPATRQAARILSASVDVHSESIAKHGPGRLFSTAVSSAAAHTVGGTSPATRQRLHIAAAEGHQQVSGAVRHSAAAHTCPAR